MSRKYIPIIGPISAGKSTFLRAFLGIKLLETGSFVTTKFVCIIKNSNRLSFSHLIPSNQRDELFIKDGPELTDSNQIVKKIKELNENFRNKNGTRKEIFYLLETPIKNIDNTKLLENVYFMDIPGLNEDNSNYVGEIFSIITMENILFEIMIFDSNDVSGDKIDKIFQKLEEKHCLKKNDNLYILNKIDERTAGEEPERLIDYFRKEFYIKFEKNENIQTKDENTGYTGIAINSYQNYFVPMNSILYEAETKYEKDFFSVLLTEYFYFSALKDKKNFYYFIEEKINNIFKDVKDDSLNDIEKEIKSIVQNTDDMKIIKESIEKLEKVNQDKTVRINLGLNIKMPKILNNITKYYLLYKKKILIGYFIPSKSYLDLQNIINNIDPHAMNSACAPVASPIARKEKKINDPILQEIFDFIKSNLKHKFKDLNNNLDALSQFILGRKVRIAFIGNISVGKSTVLNTLIGEEILPTKDEECTYRGIIIRHKNIDDYELYRTNIVEIAPDSGDTSIINFEPEKEPYCRTKDHINSYLKNKNSDKNNIGNKDAFITIQGRLKIFDYIKLDEKLIDKIEFLDLPGHDKPNNPFNKKYNSIALRFSNISIYISDPQNLLDGSGIQMMKTQYSFVKNNLHPTLKFKCFYTSLFLINKSDKISNESDKNRIKEDLFKRISELDEYATLDRMNISFFSGKFFMKYLKAYKFYVDLLEQKPLKFLELLYDEWTSNIWIKLFPWSSFIDCLYEKIYEVDKYFKLDLTLIDYTNIPPKFCQDLKSAIYQLYCNKKKKIDENEIEEIIRTLFSLKESLKHNDFSKTEYSREFFHKLKTVIEKSDELSKENIEKKIESFFVISDKLFDRQLEEETEEVKKENKKLYNLYQTKILPNIEKKLNEKKTIIRNIIENYKNKCIAILDDEIQNYEQRLKDSNYEIKIAADKLEKKITEKIGEMKSEQEKEANKIIKEIEEETKDIIDKYYKSKDLSTPNVQQQETTTFQTFITIMTSALSGIAAMAGIAIGGAATVGGVVLSTAALGAFFATGTGIIIGVCGLGIGIVVGAIIGWLWSRSTTREQYKNALDENKKNLISNFEKIENSFSNDYNVFHQTLMKEIRAHVSALYEEINFDNSKWVKIKEEYKKQKENIKLKLNNKKYNL